MDRVPLSDVVNDLLQLPEVYQAMVANKTFKRDELQYILQQIHDRFDFIVSPAHLMVFVFFLIFFYDFLGILTGPQIWGIPTRARFASDGRKLAL